MADNYSFDIVSKVDMQEVDNAVNQAIKEMRQRYDFKGTKGSITLNKKEENEIVVVTENEFRLKGLIEILKEKMIKRSIPLKALTYGKVEEASQGMVRQKISIQSGIDKERCKDIVKLIKDTKLKVQSQIMENQVRVIGRKKDDLQEVMKVIRAKDFGFHIEFANYR